MFGSEDVGVEPNAGISSVPYQGVKALRGPTTGTPSVLENLVPLPQRVFVDREPSEAFLFYALPSRRLSSAFASSHSTCPSNRKPSPARADNGILSRIYFLRL